jgi:hypothetical protein
MFRNVAAEHITHPGGPRVEETLLGVFEIRMLRKVFGPKRYGLSTGWRKYVMKRFVFYIGQTSFGRLGQGG